MNLFKRTLALLLVCVFVGVALIGCANNNNGDGNADGTNQNGENVQDTENAALGENIITMLISEYNSLNSKT